ncbi:hypothetical protein SPRG_08357 [Saprolegnia parasitica CBS 223.65]|uniref:Galactose oxidase n=1 Tax=Saprolegnia parasitica (strain CBS 223.65) TaxID=695850 RepID=A0A067CHK1_SAPPC|nr:hypothetical protein SPRG_08357 [Saprolegnia parasitica CBS 223.65]KDO26282.1 hypothetical protein SPRG_08357 [Saprolegnia parasitica CBS 223.65]|eukprot:XP_012202987.1 hypothetical protein SPRG_08357 [Saprolegnia parasitica CBS 223.65]
MRKRSVLDEVEHALYLQSVEQRVANGEDPATIDSFRKHKWKLQRSRTAGPPPTTQETTAEPVAEVLAPTSPVDNTTATTNAEAVEAAPLSTDAASPPAARVDAKRLAYQQYLLELISPALVNTPHVRFEPVIARGNDAFNMAMPCARDGATLTACNELLVLVGGSYLSDPGHAHPRAIVPRPMAAAGTVHFSNHVFVFDPASHTWEMPRCTGSFPRGRADHSAVFLPPKSLVVFGGRGKHGIVFHDVHILDVELWSWTQSAPVASPLRGRFWHAAAVDLRSARAFVFGGKDLHTVYGDFMELSLTRDAARCHAWSEPLTMGAPPTPRFGATLLPLGAGHLALVGGWEARSVPHQQARATRCLDLYVLDLFTHIWSRPRLAQHVVTWSLPCERFLCQAFVMANTLVVFGGFSYESSASSFEKPWFEREAPVAATACHPQRYVHGMTLRPVHDPYVYKLDLQVMIWRRQPMTHASAGIQGLPTAVHGGSYPTRGNSGYVHAIVADDPTHMTLLRLTLTKPHPIVVNEDEDEDMTFEVVT